MDLDNFSYEYDTYEYKDTVENREEQVEKITEDILNKDTAGLKDWLTEVSEESDIDSDVVTACLLYTSLFYCKILRYVASGRSGGSCHIKRYDG